MNIWKISPIMLIIVVHYYHQFQSNECLAFAWRFFFRILSLIHFIGIFVIYWLFYVLNILERYLRINKWATSTADIFIIDAHKIRAYKALAISHEFFQHFWDYSNSVIVLMKVSYCVFCHFILFSLFNQIKNSQLQREYFIGKALTTPPPPNPLSHPIWSCLLACFNCILLAMRVVLRTLFVHLLNVALSLQLMN